jgi:hypothetical protein
MTDTQANSNKTKFATLGKSKVITGSILTPELSGLRMILVAAKEDGKPDSDLYKLLDKKWKVASVDLKGWYAEHRDYKLGNLRPTCLNSDTWLMHALFLKKDGTVDEKALATCVKKLGEQSKYEKASIHVSTMLTDAFPQLPELLKTHCLDNGVNVYFYSEKSALVKK